MWPTIVLNDGNKLPGIAFGSAQRRSEGAQPKTVSHLLEAIQSGFTHLDTAQQYGNEGDVGEAIRRSGIPREKLFVTTKWSNGDMTPMEACERSLEQLGLDYIDLYVIHHTWTCREDYEKAWRGMEEIKERGLARSIGLSAVKPAVNMIMLHPGIYSTTLPLLRCMATHGIVPGGYSALKPLWSHDIPMMEVLNTIAERQRCAPEQILLRWCALKGAIVYTSSATAGRAETYIDARKVELNSADMITIEHVHAA